ncbi:MAG: PEP-CTERM sorting domain-containing protein [Candidatus Acidiferrales bacterium]
MRMKFVLLAGAALLLTAPAFAGSVNLCTGQAPNSDVGPSLTVGGITATGWQGTSTTAMNTATDMFCKSGGAGETGLGIDSDINGEIGTTNFIQLAGLSGSVTLNIESVQSGEGFDILGSDGNGILGTTSLSSGSGGLTDSVTVNLGSFKYLDITATSGNVLLNTVSPTPEPGTYLLMGTGLLMFGFFMRRKFASSSC